MTAISAASQHGPTMEARARAMLPHGEVVPFCPLLNRPAFRTCSKRGSRSIRRRRAAARCGSGGRPRGERVDLGDGLTADARPSDLVDIEVELAKLIEGWRPLRPTGVHDAGLPFLLNP
ncbi:hypothetical protein ACWDOR_42290 [Streptosporangium canum]